MNGPYKTPQIDSNNMKFFKYTLETKSDRRIFISAIISCYLWLSIVFFIRRIFLFYHLDLFLLGILPNFFAGFGLYLFQYLKTRKLLTSALFSFGMLALAEIIQLFTPRTFDPLDLLTSLIGIGCAEIARRLIKSKLKGRLLKNPIKI